MFMKSKPNIKEVHIGKDTITIFYHDGSVSKLIAVGGLIPQLIPEESLFPERSKNDNPIKPDYYNDSKITPFDVINDWKLGFYLGNAVKYIKRAGKKKDNSRLQDLKKIREYVDQEIRLEETKV